jgi:hypothetical protein
MQNLSILLSERVKEIKYAHYSDIVDKIRLSILGYVKKNGLIIYNATKLNIGVYCTNSIDHTRKIIDMLNKKYNDEFWKLAEDSQLYTDFKIYGKRTNVNSIKIVFDGTDLTMNLINIFDEKIYKQLAKADELYASILNDYNTLTASYESLAYQNDVSIYDFIAEHAEKLLKIYDVNASDVQMKNRTAIPAVKKADTIMIGTGALSLIYGNNLPLNLPTYSEYIYIGKRSVYDFVHEFKLKYKMIQTDMEFYGVYFELYANDGTVQYRIYDGTKKTHQYYTTSDQIRIGNYNLILRYLLLWIIFDDGQPDILYRMIKKRIVEHDKNINFYKYYGNYIGEKTSLYERYYKQIWEDKPWNYTKVLHIKN